MKYAFLKLLSALPRRLPLAALHRLGTWLGLLLWYCLPKRRGFAIASIAKHLHKPHAEAKTIARQSFIENMRSFLEIFHVGHFSMERHIRSVVRPDVLQRITKETLPIVAATAHIGSWEFMAGLPADLLPSRHCMVIVRAHEDAALNRLIFALRGARGMQVVGHRKASELVLPELRAGGFAAFLVDHNCSRKEAVFLPFLDDIAAVNSGPALLALRAKAVVCPSFLLRDNAGGYILHLGEPLYTHTLAGTIAERTESIARHYTDAVAEVVRLYPEQWFWMHQRWKTRQSQGKR
jgi:KDO2-lipid IV(A) lauroyltransferase